MLGVVAAIECVHALHARGRRLPFAIVVAGLRRRGRRALRIDAARQPRDRRAPSIRRCSTRSTRTASTMRDALRDLRARSGAHRAGAAFRREDVLAYAELHIEQGPVLETEGLPVGVVTAINGANRLIVEMRGMAGHAGTVPMALRQDALAAAAECVLAIERRCAERARAGRHRRQARSASRRDQRHPRPRACSPSTSARRATPSGSPRSTTCRGRSRAICARRGVGVDVRADARGADRPPARRLADRADRRGDRGGGAAGARAAERRRARRHGARRPHRRRHAVRALQRRGQPQSGRGHHRSRTSTSPRACSCASSRTSAGHERAGPPRRANSRASAEHEGRPASSPGAQRHDERRTTNWARGSTRITPEQVEFLRAIVRVPSDMPPGDNAPAAECAAQLLTALAFAVERHPVPEDFLRGYGMKSVTNLIVRQRFGAGGPTIALNAHGDVVPPGEGWTKPPYEGAIENGRMYGRGVAVSKSDIATYTYALAALRALAERGAACRHRRAALHLRRGVRRARRSRVAARARADAARLRDRRELQLRDRHRPQRLPAVRGHRSRPGRAWRDAGERARRVSRGRRDPAAIYAEADALKASKSQRSRHRSPDDDRRHCSRAASTPTWFRTGSRCVWTGG